MNDLHSKNVEEPIDIADLIQNVLDNAKFVAIMTVAIAAVSAIYISSVERTYIATTLVKSSSQVGSTGESSAAGLAGLLGIQASATLSPTNTDIDSTMAMMYSRPFIQDFIVKHGLMTKIFEDDWNKENNSWKSEEPSLIDAYEVIRKAIKIEFDPVAWTRRQIGYATIDVSWKDKETAAYIVNNLVIDINTFLSAKMIKESEKSIAFLDDQFTKTNVLSVRESLSKLKTEQLRNMMLANSSEDFALTVIDDALPPEFPTSPKRVQFVFIATSLGFLASIILIFLKDSIVPILKRLKFSL